MFRISTVLLLCCLSSLNPASAQNGFPDFLGNGGGFGGESENTGISISAVLIPVDASSVDVQVTVVLPPNHYIYSTNPAFGAATKIALSAPNGFEAVGGIKADREPKKVNDQYLGAIEKFFGKATWTQRIKNNLGPVQADLKISGSLEGMYCSSGEGGSCYPIQPPEKFTASMPAGYQPGSLPAGTSVAAQPEIATATGAQVGATQVVVPKLDLPADVKESPIRYTVSLSPADAKAGEYVTLSITAEIAQPWHTYSITMDPETLGGVPTKITLAGTKGLEESWKNFVATPEPKIETPLPDTILESHYDKVTWNREFVLTDDAVYVEGSIYFQVCTHKSCLNPTTVNFAVGLNGSDNTNLIAIAGTATDPESGDAADDGSGTPLSLAGLMPFILSAVSAGFLSLLTPCVFPMIPVTVSYFLKQGEDRPGSTLKLAVIYCLGIIGAFTVLGLSVAVLVGPTALPTLAGNRWLNLAFAAIFIVFSLMLLGMFEIRIPSWLLTWSSKKQDSGGVAGVLFMALTFTLVSFTCTFAFVGSLLVVAAGGSFLKPIIGMIAFSTAFASPFFLLALFPSMLKKLPKSGGWMNSVKVTLGLLELAIVMKFLSIADIGFGGVGKPQLLDFSLVVGAWIAIAAVTGAYLLGLFRLPHDSPGGVIGPVRCLMAICFFGLASYMGIGLLGEKAPEGIIWKQIAAFAPQREHEGLPFSLDFDEAVVSASEADRPIFVDVTGVLCHNCRVMEQTVISTPRIQSLIEGLERVQVYTDSVPVANVEERKRLLARNLDLQRNWLKSVALPAYAIVSPDGKEILATVGGVQSADNFARFIESGVAKWEQGRKEANKTTATVSQNNFHTN
ncbi:MAG: cytochrome c biogenesis protein CcdA [Fuerstiella sp.]|mgnify:CR=1 FL=1